MVDYTKEDNKLVISEQKIDRIEYSKDHIEDKINYHQSMLQYWQNLLVEANKLGIKSTTELISS